MEVDRYGGECPPGNASLCFSQKVATPFRKNDRLVNRFKTNLIFLAYIIRSSLDGFQLKLFAICIILLHFLHKSLKTMPYDTGIALIICSNLVIAVQHYVTMNTNLKNPQSSSPLQAKINELNDNFDFECWAREVRTQLLAALQKKATGSNEMTTNESKPVKSVRSH
ncbi:MAG TPA: hypothetical protein V6D26_12270 [Stenomitos sp.]